jgi:hypothetical protein
MKVSSKLATMKGLKASLREIWCHFDLVIDGKLPLNHEILYYSQVLPFPLNHEILYVIHLFWGVTFDHFSHPCLNNPYYSGELYLIS